MLKQQEAQTETTHEEDHTEHHPAQDEGQAAQQPKAPLPRAFSAEFY